MPLHLILIFKKIGVIGFI